MVDVNNVTDETDDYWAATTDGYHGKSTHAYQIGMAQNMTTGEYWLHYNTSDVYQSYQNVTTDDNITDVYQSYQNVTTDDNITDVYQSYQNVTTDDNITDVYQSYQNVTADDNTIDEYSTLLFALLIFKWTLCPFILIGNGLTIIVVGKYIKKITPTHVLIAFLSVAGFFVGISDLLNFIIYLMRGNSVQSEQIYDLILWMTLVA